MTEEQFLEQFVFYRLKNQNDGFDSDGIRHFAVKDFLTVLKRTEELNVTVLGIEQWCNKQLEAVKYIEDYGWHLNWHKQALSDIYTPKRNMLYTATYEVPHFLLNIATC